MVLRRSRDGDRQDFPASAARQFFYLDELLTQELLSGLEHGAVAGEHETLEGETGRSLDAKVGTGVPGAEISVGAGRSKKQATRVEREKAQTPEGRFARLAQLLRDRKELRRFETIDRERCSSLVPGEFVEVVGDLSIDNVNGLAGALVRARCLARELQQEEPLKATYEQTVAAVLVRVYALVKATPLVDPDPVMTAVDQSLPEFSFRAKVDARKIRDALDEDTRTQRATFLGKVNRLDADEIRVTLVGIYR